MLNNSSTTSREEQLGLLLHIPSLSIDGEGLRWIWLNFLSVQAEPDVIMNIPFLCFIISLLPLVGFLPSPPPTRFPSLMRFPCVRLWTRSFIFCLKKSKKKSSSSSKFRLGFIKAMRREIGKNDNEEANGNRMCALQIYVPSRRVFGTAKDLLLLKMRERRKRRIPRETEVGGISP